MGFSLGIASVFQSGWMVPAELFVDGEKNGAKWDDGLC
jgi:hypothetical protein